MRQQPGRRLARSKRLICPGVQHELCVQEKPERGPSGGYCLDSGCAYRDLRPLHYVICRAVLLTAMTHTRKVMLDAWIHGRRTGPATRTGSAGRTLLPRIYGSPVLGAHCLCWEREARFCIVSLASTQPPYCYPQNALSTDWPLDAPHVQVALAIRYLRLPRARRPAPVCNTRRACASSSAWPRACPAASGERVNYCECTQSRVVSTQRSKRSLYVVR